MKKFQFRLETLLSLRKRREEEIRLELGRKMREMESARKMLDKLTHSFADLQETDKRGRPAITSAQELRFSAAWRFKLRTQIMHQEQLLAGMSSEAAGIRSRLVRAKQQHRAIEIIRERKFEEWREELNRAEQNFMDELALRRQGSGGAVREFATGSY